MTLEPGSESTVRRILLGAQLRRFREAAGITREDAGYTIRASASKISRMELGRFGFKERDIVDLLTLYGVTDEEERYALLLLAREANTPGWWHKYGDVLPSWFQVYIGLEGAATLIRTYEIQFVPGLLQTADYARALTQRAQPSMPADELERRVSLRMTRQRLLTRSTPARLWAVVDEAALRRPIGGLEVMRAQLEHLATCTKQPNITLQVMPFRVGGHAAEGGAFSILRFPEPDLPDIVYIEQLTSALYLDKRADVDLYLDAMERLCVDSEPPEKTASILDKLLKETEMEHVPNGIPAADIAGVHWEKSRWSNSQGNCVEVAELPSGQIAVRNSRDPDGPALIYTRAEIAAWLRGAKDGDFDHLAI